ncbi:MAG TPA: cytochrome c maturation protein CcmE [Vicinamibacterales bacterium]|jgi:cytochrome c-type biogenesis protein CcmE|nr:cytochrome c maturation protein CcmE [Vicinamibacterales bacterium]
MTHRNIKISATVLVLGLAFAGLMWSAFSDGADYFKEVNEVVANKQAWESKPLQLHGYVVPGSIFVNPKAMEYHFKVQNNGAVLSASYTGIVPDTFKDEAEVVLSGRLTDQGFETKKNGIVAKCPSKYVERANLQKAG